MESYKSQHERETRALQLKKRKLKLQDMLDRERDQYEVGRKVSHYGHFLTHKVRSDGLAMFPVCTVYGLCLYIMPSLYKMVYMICLP